MSLSMKIKLIGDWNNRIRTLIESEFKGEFELADDKEQELTSVKFNVRDTNNENKFLSKDQI